MVERSSTSIFACSSRVDDVVLRAVASTGVPAERLWIGVEHRAQCLGRSSIAPWRTRPINTRRLSEAHARAELRRVPEDFVLLDGETVLRLAYDDHDRLVVGFVEPDGARDRYRLIRDVLWAAAADQPTHGVRLSPDVAVAVRGGMHAPQPASGEP
jgi:hypothetical protein